MKKSINFLAFKNTACVMACALLLGACEEDPLMPVPAVPPPTQSTPEVPAPEPGDTRQDAPIKGKTIQLRWSTLDFQELHYNLAGHLTRYVSQYNSVQGTDVVSRFTYDMEYDAQNRLVRQTTNNRVNTRYFYNGDVLEKAIEYDLLDRPLNEYHFTFNSQNQLVAQVKSSVSLDHVVTEKEKYTYQYDQRGNLVVVGISYKKPETGAFEPSVNIHFGDFDNHQNVLPYLSTPLLPQVRFWKNNPGSKVVKAKDGQVLPGAEHYAYAYHPDGYPVKRTTSADVGNNKKYTYTGDFLYTEVQ